MEGFLLTKFSDRSILGRSLPWDIYILANKLSANPNIFRSSHYFKKNKAVDGKGGINMDLEYKKIFRTLL